MFLLWVCVLCFPVMAVAQVESRAEQIEAERVEKARRLEPDVPSKPERVLQKIKDEKILERLTEGIAGFRVKFGGLATGSGFALGPEYLRRDFARGRIVLRGSASASLKKYTLLDLELDMPALAGDRVFLNLYGARRDFPEMQYYGPGPDSAKGSRSNYRLEEMGFDATGGMRPIRHFNLGATGGYLQVNVGPGTSNRFISSELIFGPDLVPGIDRQSNFLRGGLFAQYDYRDFPGEPRRGGNYLVRYSLYSDREFDAYSFRKLEMELQQYVPFFNERRVIALRGKSVVTYADNGNRVPFYLQPTVGGSDDLRGFRPFRFHDDNMLILNGEYRWETFSGLDMALFVDGGKVFHRRAEFNLADLEGSAGFGMRFNVKNSVFMRIDVGFSHEGFQVWVKFNNVF